MIDVTQDPVGFELFERVKGSTPIATPEGAALFQEVERSFAGLQVLRQARATSATFARAICALSACRRSPTASFL